MLKRIPLKKIGARAKRNAKPDKEWRDAVKKRDNYKCQNPDCLSDWYYGKDKHAHHIVSKQSRPDLRHDIDNGITLCPICHALVESGNLVFEWNGRLIS